MNEYRYSLEKYNGRNSRHVCPECGRKQVFTRYIDNETKQYIADNVGKCNRLDKCGYHYTPKQYFDNNPWKKDNYGVALLQDIGKSNKATATPKPAPRPAPKAICTLPEAIIDCFLRVTISFYVG